MILLLVDLAVYRVAIYSNHTGAKIYGASNINVSKLNFTTGDKFKYKCAGLRPFVLATVNSALYTQIIGWHFSNIA